MFSVLPLKCIVDVFPPALLLNSPLQRAGTSEYWMTGIFEILQHFLRRSIPRSIKFAIKFRTTSFRIQAPGKTNDRE